MAASQPTVDAALDKNLASLGSNLADETYYANPRLALQALIRISKAKRDEYSIVVPVTGTGTALDNDQKIAVGKKAAAIQRSVVFHLLAGEAVAAVTPNPMPHPLKRLAAVRGVHLLSDADLAMTLEYVAHTRALLSDVRARYGPVGGRSMAERLETMIIRKGGSCGPLMEVCSPEMLEANGSCPMSSVDNLEWLGSEGLCVPSAANKRLAGEPKDLRLRLEWIQNQCARLLTKYNDPEKNNYRDKFNAALVDKDAVTRMSTIMFDENDVAITRTVINHLYTSEAPFLARVRADLDATVTRLKGTPVTHTAGLPTVATAAPADPSVSQAAYLEWIAKKAQDNASALLLDPPTTGAAETALAERKSYVVAAWAGRRILQASYKKGFVADNSVQTFEPANTGDREAFYDLTHMASAKSISATVHNSGFAVGGGSSPSTAEIEATALAIKNQQEADIGALVIATWLYFKTAPDVLLSLCEISIQTQTPFAWVFDAFKAQKIADLQNPTILAVTAAPVKPTAAGAATRLAAGFDPADEATYTALQTRLYNAGSALANGIRGLWSNGWAAYWSYGG